MRADRGCVVQVAVGVDEADDATHRPVRAAILSSAARLSATKPGLSTRSSGGYPVTASSGTDEHVGSCLLGLFERVEHTARRCRRGRRRRCSAGPSPPGFGPWRQRTEVRHWRPMVDRRRSRRGSTTRSSDRRIRSRCGSRSTASARGASRRSRIASRRTRTCAMRSSRCAARAGRSRCSSRSTSEHVDTAQRSRASRAALDAARPRCAQAMEDPRVPPHRRPRPPRPDELEATVEADRSARVLTSCRAAASLVDTAPTRLAVIGMGKLGGDELNYASDIDVMFVGDGDPATLERAARARHRDRAGAASASTPTSAPRAATARSCARSTRYEAYWDRWAEPWEFQALLKARPVAGDAELGARFDDSAGAAPVAHAVHRRRPPRAARDEGAGRGRRSPARASTDRELKRGRGGIRDIEFAVQLLQLVHGRARRRRCARPTTLDALARDGRGRLRRPRRRRPRWPTPTASCARSSTACSSSTSSRCTRCPTDPSGARRASPASLGYRDTADGTALRAVRRGAARGTRRRCARSTSGSTSGRCSRRSPARRRAARQPGRRRGPPERVRLHRRRRAPQAAVRELTRGLNRVVPADAADAAADARLAVGVTRPRPRAAAPAQPARPGSQRRPSWSRRSATRPRRPGGCAALARHQPAARRHPAAQPRPRRPAARSRAARARRPEADARRERRGRPLSWRATSRNARPACGGGRTATSLGIAARDVLGDGRRRRRSGRDADARSPRPSLEAALAALEPTVPFAVIALGRFGGAELSLRQRPRRPLRLRRARRPPTSRRPTRSRPRLRRFVGGATPAGRHLRDRRRPAARGQAGPAGAQPRGLPRPTSSARRWCGSARP